MPEQQNPLFASGIHKLNKDKSHDFLFAYKRKGIKEGKETEIRKQG